MWESEQLASSASEMFGWIWKFRMKKEDTLEMWSEMSLPENGVVDWSVGVYASRTTRLRDSVIPELGLERDSLVFRLEDLFLVV